MRSLLISGVCVLLGVAFSIREYYLYSYRNEPVSWGRAFGEQVPYWLFWAVLSPVIIWLAARWPLGGQKWQRPLSVHLTTSLILAFVFPFFSVLVSLQPDSQPSSTAPTSGRLSQFFLITVILGMVSYWVVLAFVTALDYHQQYQVERIRSSELRAQLAQSQLQALRMQLQPHFLFNTLHSVTALVLNNENRAAMRMISRLGELLRLTLDDNERQIIPLKEELEFIERYLEIERIRFQDRLTVHIAVSPETLIANVPKLILQPLVENAVRHAIEPLSSASRIEITAKRIKGMTQLEVRDDGPGLPENWMAANGHGIGLRNTHARLRQLYGRDYQFDLRNAEKRGTIATITFPFDLDRTTNSKPRRRSDELDSDADSRR